jgi:uncharacterized protein YndB with AHSA1/START domain
MSDLGEVTRCYTLTYRRRSKHPVARLWRAITDPDEVSRWMSYPARIDLRPGGDYFVDFSRTTEGSLDGVIVRAEPERMLTYVWGLSVHEWKLERDGDGCRYTYVHHGQPPGLVPQDEGIAAGWHVWLDDLEAYLNGIDPPADDEHARTQSLGPLYRERLDAVLG